MHTLARLSPDARRTTWSFFWGSLMSVLPVLAVLPSVRLLGVAMLGIAAVVGVMLEGDEEGLEGAAKSALIGRASSSP